MLTHEQVDERFSDFVQRNFNRLMKVFQDHWVIFEGVIYMDNTAEDDELVNNFIGYLSFKELRDTLLEAVQGDQEYVDGVIKSVEICCSGGINDKEFVIVNFTDLDNKAYATVTGFSGYEGGAIA